MILFGYSGNFKDIFGKQWLETGLRDPDRYFPKKQAHPIRKSLPRVIACASLVDQLVTRIFFQAFTEAEGVAYPFIVTKKGIGFNSVHAKSIGDVYSTFNRIFKSPPVCSDVSGFEKNFTLDMAKTVRLPMLDTMSSGNHHLFARAFDWWMYSLLGTPGVVDSGKLIVFTDPHRVQRSGNFLTTTANGISRCAIAFCLGNFPSSMGDDCYEWTAMTKQQMIDAYNAVGLPVRDVEVQSFEVLNFCSHAFRLADGVWSSWLTADERMLYECAHSKVVDPGSDANWISEIANNPDKVRVATVIGFINSRNLLLGAVAEHEEDDEDSGGGL